MRQQIGERHLPSRPCRYRSGFLCAHLHVGGHVPEPYKFELAAREEEHILRFQLADECFLHMAEHGTPQKPHRDCRCGGDRADVESVQSGDGLLPHPVAVDRVIPLQLSVARIGPEAFPALLQKQKTPVPVVLAEIGIGRTTAHRLKCLLGIEARPAGQTCEVLQQHIQRSMGWLALFHQAIVQASANRTQLQ